METRLITSIDELAALEPDWRRLAAGNPFLGPEWLATWWRHFRTRNRRLAVLAVSDPREGVVALAPWYLSRSLWFGRTLRFLGSGAVCTEYPSFPCAKGFRRRAAAAIAEWLYPSATNGTGVAWETLALAGIAEDDRMVRHLLRALERRGAVIGWRPADPCWRLELPERWDDYLSLVSKAHRKRIRRLERKYFDTGRARLVRVESHEQWERGFEILVDLHTRRWVSRGGTGIFSKQRMYDFHRQATRELLAGGQLRMAWLELDGRPVAAEYSLTGDEVIYAYQSGMDPDAEQHTPGTLALIATLRVAIEEGYRAVDFLRGDEPYKQHWRARPRQTRHVRVFPGRLSGRVTHAVWQTGANAKDLLRSGRDAALRAAGRSAMLLPLERDDVVSIPLGGML